MKRRRWLSAVWAIGCTPLLRPLPAWAGRILGLRIWPARDYTRITIESDQPLQAQHLVLAHPPRLALDIQGSDLSSALRPLVQAVQARDPNLSGIRVGQYTTGTTRLVLDLKQVVEPQLFNLPPVAAYQHRLVLDLYPATRPDPLQDLIQRLSAPGALPATGPATADHPLPEELAALWTGPGPATTATPALRDPLEALVARHSERTGTADSPPARDGRTTPLPDRTALARPRPTEPATRRLILVAIDPGHGGEDPGAIGPGGTQEKDVVLRIARQLYERLNRSQFQGQPVRAILTREDDLFVPLHVRVEKARRVQADLFISVHADAFFSPRPKGASVYALSDKGASSAAARWIANKENAADLVGGLNMGVQDRHIQRTLLDMSTTAQIKDSLKLGHAMLGEMGRVGTLHKPRVEQAAFAVLKAPDIPSVLVETAFISNPEEEQRLNDPKFQSDLADALTQGIERYFAQNPPLARNRAL